MENLPRSRVAIDIGNTHIHVGRHENDAWIKIEEIPTQPLIQGDLAALKSIWTSNSRPEWAAFCSVVPKASEIVAHWLQSQQLACGFCELNHRTVTGIGIDYPKPQSIGPDRLANAMAASRLYGAPSIVVDFGTAVTFDVLDLEGNYVGGIIAPGVSVMTDYLHEKTALLPRIEIKDPGSAIGKNTEQAMQIGAVYGYRGLIRQLIEGLKQELGTTQIPVIATGGYAELIAGGLDCITEVRPHLTLEGLLLLDPHSNQKAKPKPALQTASLSPDKSRPSPLKCLCEKNSLLSDENLHLIAAPYGNIANQYHAVIRQRPCPGVRPLAPAGRRDSCHHFRRKGRVGGEKWMRQDKPFQNPCQPIPTRRWRRIPPERSACRLPAPGI